MTAGNYQIVISPQAKRQLKKLAQDARAQIVRKIDALSRNPRPKNVKKLSGYRDYFRIRAGNYRIVYAIEDDKLIIIIIGVGDRKEVYRDL